MNTTPDRTLNDYTWIVACGFVASLVASFGIGANDVANAFSSSVGARTLSLRHACALACLCEVSGAVLMGSHVTNTIRKSIANVDCFQSSPPIFLYGNLCVLVSMATWLLLATHFELPVSTTHSCIGGIIGMTLVAVGPGCVVWYEPLPYFPYLGGVSAIVFSWFLSPVVSALASYLCFYAVRVLLRSPRPFERVWRLYPVLVLFTVTVNAFFIIYKGSGSLGLDDLPVGTAMSASLGLGATSAFVSVLVGKRLRRRIEQSTGGAGGRVAELSLPIRLESPGGSASPPDFRCDEPGVAAAAAAFAAEDDAARGAGAAVVEIELTRRHSPRASSSLLTAPAAASSTANDTRGSSAATTAAATTAAAAAKDPTVTTVTLSKLSRELSKPLSHDPFASLASDASVADIHARVERFDTRSEYAFSYLQVLTACTDSFAHGANDVANAIGPLAALYVTWAEGSVSSKAVMGGAGYWILLLGGVGMSLGLLVYGYKIMRTVGVKLAAITPSRGFSIELSSALVVIVGSRLGWPLSTTQCQVGAVCGVALLERGRGINRTVLLRTATGWLLTLVASGAISALLFAWGVYSPPIL